MTYELLSSRKLAASAAIMLGSTMLIGCTSEAPKQPTSSPSATAGNTDTLKTFSDCQPSKQEQWAGLPTNFIGPKLAEFLQVDVSELAMGAWGPADCSPGILGGDIATGAPATRVSVDGFDHTCAAIGVNSPDSKPPVDGQKYTEIIVACPGNPTEM